MMVALVAIATLLGHIFPIYYGFKGGNRNERYHQRR